MAVDLRAGKRDLLAFSVLVGHELAGWQAASLRLSRRTTAIVAPRQSGKSRSLAVLALWWAYRNRDQRVLIVSAGEGAARRLLSEAASVAARSPLLMGSVLDENSGLIVLSNHSEIRSVPASERAVRGWSTDLLLIDEAAQVEDALLLGAALPTVAARERGRIVLAGSPGDAAGAFYEFSAAGEVGDPHVETFRWRLDQASWITPEVVATARAALPPALFRREFEAEFADAGAMERVVDRGWIEAAQQRSLSVDPGDRGVLGVDVARGGSDQSVAVWVRGGVARVLWSSRGADLMATTGRIVALAGETGAPVWIDAIGLGAGVYDRLVEQKIHVVPFIASARASRPDRFLNTRAEGWWAAREAFREGLVDLDPDDRVLAGQLASVSYKLTSSGSVQVASKESMRTSPDFADALIIGLWGARQAAGFSALAQMAREARAAPLHPLLADVAGRQRSAQSIVPLASHQRESLGGLDDLTSDLWDKPW